MASVVTVANNYSSSSCTVTNPSNAYNDTTNTTFAVMSFTLSNGYCDFKGFDFSSIPGGSVINSITYKASVFCGYLGWTLTTRAYINGNLKASASFTKTSRTVKTLTISDSATLAELKAASSNNYFRVTINSAKDGMAACGFDITVNYTPPTGNPLFFGMNF